MEINGVNVDELNCNDIVIPEIVPGRVLQVDGDHLCYLSTYDDDVSFAECRNNAKDILYSWMLMAGAEEAVVHLTGDNKGNRYTIATVKEYQANRKGKAKPKNLSNIRGWIMDTWDNVMFHEDQEADDGMAQGNYEAWFKGTPELSVICSIDKDLRMCSGLHLNQITGELVEVHGYGSIHLTEGKSKQVKGYGTSFFWAQMLMGDVADNIPGLPGLGVDTLIRIPEFRSKALDKLLDKVESGDAMKIIPALEKIKQIKPKKCGAVAAYTLLKDCTNDQEAMNVVLQAYREFYEVDEIGTVEVQHYNGMKMQTTPGEMLMEQAKLLWMRRVEDEGDVRNFLISVCTGGNWECPIP